MMLLTKVEQNIIQIGHIFQIILILTRDSETLSDMNSNKMLNSAVAELFIRSR